MTADVKDEAAKNGMVRRHHAVGVMRPAAVVAGGAEVADLQAMCRHVADLARTRSQAPSRIRVEHLGTVLEVEWLGAAGGGSGAGSAPGSGSGSRSGSGSGSAAEAVASPVGSADPASPADSMDSMGPVPDDGMQRVCAPMIGTFYHAPEPGAAPFVAVGDTVVPGQQVGILEVMKMMSPVEAQVAGIVREILVADGASVEFRQPLMVVEPVGG